MNKEIQHKILKVQNRIEELAVIEIFLEDLGDAWELDPSLVLSLNLVIEEAFTNIVKYGYDDNGEHIIEIIFSHEPDLLTIEIIDDGHHWDPTIKEDPDISLSAEERPVGGLGIFLIRKIMNTVVYQRIENQNYLKLTKKI